MAQDFYAILGIPESATADQIKKAYRKLAKQYHPDANPDNPKAAERFKEISEAHGVIEPETLVTLTFGLGGTIIDVAAVRGQEVAAGDVLAQLRRRRPGHRPGGGRACARPGRRDGGPLAPAAHPLDPRRRPGPEGPEECRPLLSHEGSPIHPIFRGEPIRFLEPRLTNWGPPWRSGRSD